MILSAFEINSVFSLTYIYERRAMLNLCLCDFIGVSDSLKLCLCDFIDLSDQFFFLLLHTYMREKQCWNFVYVILSISEQAKAKAEKCPTKNIVLPKPCFTPPPLETYVLPKPCFLKPCFSETRFFQNLVFLDYGWNTIFPNLRFFFILSL